MIETLGSIFEAPALVLVNPVNCVGVMGRGLALEFKKRYPWNFKAYVEVCDGRLRPGNGMFYIEQGTIIFNFPTKRHWRDKSRLEDITLGLEDLRSTIIEQHWPSVAIPLLGAGLGGLNKELVEREIRGSLETLSEARILLCMGRPVG